MNPEEKMPYYFKHEKNPIDSKIIQSTVLDHEKGQYLEILTHAINTVQDQSLTSTLTSLYEKVAKELELSYQLKSKIHIGKEVRTVYQEDDAQDESLQEEIVVTKPREGVSEAEIATLKDLQRKAHDERVFYEEFLKEHYPDTYENVHHQLRNLDNLSN